MSVSDLAATLATRPALALPLVFAGGVLTSLTPCIYPMIPITAAVVGGQAAAGSAPAPGARPRRRAIALTAAYVLGLSLAYASLGLVAGLTGTLFGGITDLAQYVGRTPVVLEFWATWCPLCKKLEPSMAAAREQYAGRVTFVSVGVPNNQSPERQKAYATEKQLGGEFVFDRDSKAVAAYKAPHTSYVVVVDKADKVVYTDVGGDQDIGAATAKAFAPTAGRDR